MRTLRVVQCLAVIAAVHAPGALAQPAHITAGQSLATGQTMQSPNKQYVAVQQNDGNFCVYKGTPSKFESLLWCHHKTAPGGQYVTVMQSDGNLCTYTGTPSQLVKLSWCNYATAPGGQYVLAMQDDGNLCVYTGTPTQYVKNMWCHNTNVAPPPPAPAHLTTGQSLTAGQALQSPNKQYVARQQNDGNLCVYKGNLTSQERVLWCHHKVAPGGQYVTAMQSDGNLCTYTGTTSQYVKNTWCTNAVAPGGQYVLAMQDDGNLCVYTGTPTQYGKNLWCHNTGMATSPAGPAGPRKGVTVVNNSASFSWITINQNVSGINQIIKSGCIAPRGERSWPEVLLTDIPGAVSAIRVRVERTSTTNCASQPNNAHVTCDTRTEWWNRQTVVEASVSGLKYMLYTFDENCKIAVSKGR